MRHGRADGVERGGVAGLRERHREHQRPVGSRPEALLDQVVGLALGGAGRRRSVVDLPQSHAQHRRGEGQEDGQAGEHRGPPMA